MGAAWVYIVECRDGSYYTGMTTRLPERMSQHELCEANSYIAMHGFGRLLWTTEFSSLDEASRAEKQIKGWTRAKKEALMKGDFERIHELSICQNRSSSLKRGILSHTTKFHGGTNRI